MRRVNSVEKGIYRFKKHFISSLATVHPEFPVHLWCILLPVANAMLNLLRPFRLNSRLSIEESLVGIFDYNKSPTSLPGCKVLAYELPGQRNT